MTPEEKYRRIVAYARHFTNDHKELAHTFLEKMYTSGRNVLEDDFPMSYVWIGLQRLERGMRKQYVRRGYLAWLNGFADRTHSKGDAIDKIALQEIIANVDSNDLPILDLRMMGFTSQEIADKLGFSKFQVEWAIKRIKKNIKKLQGMSVNMGNPFAGSRVKVTKQISLKVWEGKKYDHNDYEEEDYNEFYKLMIHKESGEGLLVRLPECDGNEYIEKLVKEGL